jgi:hypothetical protein
MNSSQLKKIDEVQPTQQTKQWPNKLNIGKKMVKKTYELQQALHCRLFPLLPVATFSSSHGS